MNKPSVKPETANLAKTAVIVGAAGAIGVIAATAVVSAVSSKLLDAAVDVATLARKRTGKTEKK